MAQAEGLKHDAEKLGSLGFMEIGHTGLYEQQGFVVQTKNGENIGLWVDLGGHMVGAPFVQKPERGLRVTTTIRNIHAIVPQADQTTENDFMIVYDAEIKMTDQQPTYQLIQLIDGRRACKKGQGIPNVIQAQTDPETFRSCGWRVRQSGFDVSGSGCVHLKKTNSLTQEEKELMIVYKEGKVMRVLQRPEIVITPGFAVDEYWFEEKHYEQEKVRMTKKEDGRIVVIEETMKVEKPVAHLRLRTENGVVVVMTVRNKPGVIKEQDQVRQSQAKMKEQVSNLIPHDLKPDCYAALWMPVNGDRTRLNSELLSFYLYGLEPANPEKHRTELEEGLPQIKALAAFLAGHYEQAGDEERITYQQRVKFYEKIKEYIVERLRISPNEQAAVVDYWTSLCSREVGRSKTTNQEIAGVLRNLSANIDKSHDNDTETTGDRTLTVKPAGGIYREGYPDPVSPFSDIESQQLAGYICITNSRGEEIVIHGKEIEEIGRYGFWRRHPGQLLKVLKPLLGVEVEQLPSQT